MTPIKNLEIKPATHRLAVLCEAAGQGSSTSAPIALFGRAEISRDGRFRRRRPLRPHQVSGRAGDKHCVDPAHIVHRAS